MDQIYVWIIILFIVILYLDYCEKYYKKEDFTNNNSTDNKISYFEENKLTLYEENNNENRNCCG